jgi:hypothetical protein
LVYRYGIVPARGDPEYGFIVLVLAPCEELICIRISKDVSEEETVLDFICWACGFDHLYDRE